MLKLLLSPYSFLLDLFSLFWNVSWLTLLFLPHCKLFFPLSSFLPFVSSSELYLLPHHFFPQTQIVIPFSQYIQAQHVIHHIRGNKAINEERKEIKG